MTFGNLLPGVANGSQITVISPTAGLKLSAWFDIDGTIGWNGTIVDKEGLINRLAVVAMQADQPEVHLRPNKLVTYKVVAMVMANAQRLGVTKIGLIGNEQFLN